LSNIAEWVFRNDAALLLAKNESDTRLVVRMAEHVINGGEVEVHLPRILRLERRHLQIDDNEASELQVVEEEIDLEVLASNFKRNLAADKSESDAELDEKLA
jgi:hypothetical protein